MCLISIAEFENMEIYNKVYPDFLGNEKWKTSVGKKVVSDHYKGMFKNDQVRVLQIALSDGNGSTIEITDRYTDLKAKCDISWIMYQFR